MLPDFLPVYANSYFNEYNWHWWWVKYKICIEEIQMKLIHHRTIIPILQTVIYAFKIVLQYVKYLRRIKNQSLLTRVEICLLKSTPTDDCSRKRVSVNVYLSFCGFSTKNECWLSAIRVYNFITCQCKRSFNNYNEYHIHTAIYNSLNLFKYCTASFSPRNFCFRLAKFVFWKF